MTLLVFSVISYITLRSKIEILNALTESQEKINYMAYHDELTGLPNRYLLNKYLNITIDRAKQRELTVGIMFIDLDRFKIINDTLGHSYGDLLLRQASDRINACIRKNDILLRYGGDEFVIIMDELDKNSAEQVAKIIINEFKQPFVLKDHEAYTSPSIGVCFYPLDGETPEMLIKNADAAMYFAKEQGKNNYRFYTKELNEIVTCKQNST